MRVHFACLLVCFSQVINQLLLGTDWGELEYLIIDMPPGGCEWYFRIRCNVRLFFLSREGGENCGRSAGTGRNHRARWDVEKIKRGHSPCFRPSGHSTPPSHPTSPHPIPSIPHPLPHPLPPPPPPSPPPQRPPGHNSRCSWAYQSVPRP